MMKTLVSLLPVSLALAVAGCSSPSPITLNRVGPVPQASISMASDGYLVVYPPALPLTTLDDPDMSFRSVCRVRSDDGALYRKVAVWSPAETKQPLALPAGSYTVEARAANRALVHVPVVIEPDRTTVVRLNGELSSEALAALD